MKEFIETIIKSPEIVDKLPAIAIISATMGPGLPWQN